VDELLARVRRAGHTSTIVIRADSGFENYTRFDALERRGIEFSIGVKQSKTIRALIGQIRKTIKTRGQFPTDDAARKLLYLAIINAEKKWHQTYNWTSASAAFKIHFGDRYPH
jgi:transposase-like protein